MVSVIALGALGQTINIMTLGGLALAVGILVDDATVDDREHRPQPRDGQGPRARRSSTARSRSPMPAFVSTLCICIVFVPMFFLTGVARYLFVPLAEAVIFAMLASYLLSRTLVPTLAMYLLDREHALHAADDAAGSACARRYQRAFEHALRAVPRRLPAVRSTPRSIAPRLFAAAFLAFCVGSLGHRGRARPRLLSGGGRRADPPAHARRTGLRIEETARLADEVDALIRETIAPRDLVDDPRQHRPALQRHQPELQQQRARSARRTPKSWSSSAPTARRRRTTYVRRLRAQLPRRFPGAQFFFQPADIVTQILNFGTPAPDRRRDHRRQPARQLSRSRRSSPPASGTCPGAVDVHVQQAFDAPTLHLDIDRARAQSVGLNARDVAQNVLVSLSSSFQTAPAFWLDPQNGVSYSVVGADAAVPRSTRCRRSTTRPVGGAATGAAADPRQPRDDDDHDARGRGLPLQRAADDQRVRVGRRAATSAPSRTTSRAKIAAVEPRRCPRGSAGRHARPGRDDAVVVHRAGATGWSAPIVLAYLLIVVNFQSWLDPFIIIIGAARRAGGHRLDAAADAHDAQRAVADGRDHVHGRRDREQHPARLVRARAHARRPVGARGRARRRVRAHPAGADDGARDDHRHAADGHRPRRGRRAERAARPRGRRRPDRRDGRDAVLRALRVRDPARADGPRTATVGEGHVR